MKSIKNRGENKWKKIAFFLMLFLVFGLLLNSVKNVYNKKEAAQTLLTKMNREKTKLEERNKFLQESLSKLETEEGIKFAMRKKLNVAEVGESVAIIVDEKPKTSAITPISSFWQKFKNFFSRAK